MLLCCLAQNINNGLQLFNPKKKDAPPLCSQKYLQPLIVESYFNPPYEVTFRSIAYKFWKKSGNVSKEDLNQFDRLLRELKNNNLPNEKLNVLLASLITCILLVDEKLLKTEDRSIANLVKLIFDTLSNFAEHLPVPHVLGLFHLILHHLDVKSNVCESKMISQLAKYLPKESRSRFLAQLMDRIKKMEDPMTRFWLSCIYGMVAAQSEFRYEILDSFIEAWKNSDSIEFRTNFLVIISELIEGVDVAKCIETVRVIHTHAKAKDELRGLYVLTKSLAEKMKNGTHAREQIDYLFELFQQGINDEERENLSSMCVSSIDLFRPMLSISQKKLALHQMILLLNKPKAPIHNIAWPLYFLIRDLPESERTSHIVPVLPISGVDCLALFLKYRSFSPNEIENLLKLPIGKWPFTFSYRLHDNMSYWIELIKYTSLETVRLITAKLFELNPEKPYNWPHGYPIISTKDLTEEQHAGILKAAVKCLQIDDYEVQKTGLWVIEQLAKEGCNLSLYKDMLLTPLLGCILVTKYPAYTIVCDEVVRLIGHLVPGLVGDDFDVVVKGFMCLQYQNLFSSRDLIQTIGLLLEALQREDKTHLVDYLLVLLFKTIKDDDMSSSLSGEWLVKSQGLSIMSELQLNRCVVELHSWLKEDYSKYRFRIIPVLAAISSRSNEWNQFIKNLFGEELLTDLRQDITSLEKLCANFGTLAFTSVSRSDRSKYEAEMLQESKKMEEREKKRKK